MTTKQRLRDRLRAYREGERGVSPVIGVILMVAITVILAAVIGAFVLGLGGEQETAPKTAITFQEENAKKITMFNKSPRADGTGRNFVAPGGCLAYNDDVGQSANNWVEDADYRIPTEVSAIHDGGDAMQQNNIRVKIEATNGTDIGGDDVVAEGIAFDPSPIAASWPGDKPDQCETAGTNPNVTSEFGVKDAPVFTSSVKWHPRTENEIQVNSEAVVSHWLVPDVDNVSSPDTGEVGSTKAIVWSTANGYADYGTRVSSDDLLEDDRQCLVHYDTGKSDNTSDITVSAAYENSFFLPEDPKPTGSMVYPGDIDGNLCSLGYKSNYQEVSDDINGPLTEDDTVKVVWSPPSSDKTQVLGEHTVE